MHSGLVRDPAAECRLLNEQHDMPELHVRLHLRLPTQKPSGGGNGRQESDISRGARNILREPREIFIWSACCLMTSQANYHLTSTLPYMFNYELTDTGKDFQSRTERNANKWEMKSSVKWLLPWYVSPVPFCFVQWAAGGFFHTVAVYGCHGFCRLGRKSCRRNERDLS